MEVYAAVLVDISLGDEIMQLRLARVQAEPFHDLAQLVSRDIA